MPDKIVAKHLPMPAGPYSHLATGAGLVWTAGFGPHDPRTGTVPEGIAAQTAACLENVAAALRTLSLDWSDVVKTTVHLHELARDFAAFNEVYAQYVTPPYPVRTTVGSTLLGILVEIDVVAIPRNAGRPNG